MSLLLTIVVGALRGVFFDNLVVKVDGIFTRFLCKHRFAWDSRVGLDSSEDEKNRCLDMSIDHGAAKDSSAHSESFGYRWSSS